MNRRDFVRRAGLIIAGAPLVRPALAVVGGSVVVSSDVDALPTVLRILTDRPEKAYRSAGLRLAGLNPLGQVVDVETRSLAGSFVGDAVLTHSGRVVVPEMEDSREAEWLRSMAKDLGLPQGATDPTLVTFRIGRPKGPASSARIEVGGQLVGQMSLSRDSESIAIQGVGGTLRVRVKAGEVSIVEASCRHRTCMKMGAASRPGDELLCVPAQIRIVIPGVSARGVDAVSR